MITITGAWNTLEYLGHGEGVKTRVKDQHIVLVVRCPEPAGDYGGLEG